MTIRYLVIKEIVRRKINFFLGLLSVVIAVAALVAYDVKPFFILIYLPYP